MVERGIALLVSLQIAVLAAAPAADTHRCLAMNRPMAANHACCPKRADAKLTQPGRIEKPCCETISARVQVASAPASRYPEVVTPPEWVGTLDFCQPPSLFGIVGTLDSRARALPPRDLARCKRSTVLII